MPEPLTRDEAVKLASQCGSDRWPDICVYSFSSLNGRLVNERTRQGALDSLRDLRDWYLTRPLEDAEAAELGALFSDDLTRLISYIEVDPLRPDPDDYDRAANAAAVDDWVSLMTRPGGQPPTVTRHPDGSTELRAAGCAGPAWTGVR